MANGGHSEQERHEANDALARRERELLAALADAQHAHEDLRVAQLQLIEAEKMESVGRLAAGIAHEVKNPLAILAMGIDYLSRCKSCQDEQVPMVLQRMRSAVARADAVIRGLLDFSAPTTLNAVPADINDLVGPTLLLVKHEMQRNHVRVETDLGVNLPRVLLDALKMEQVLVNLFLNAVQAMERGGTLVIRTYACARPAGDDTDPPPESEAVIVEVEDTGPGIAEEHLRRVFDPFFTTKAPGKGTGLGLTVARAIVEMHGGTLELQNRAEGGVRATMTLPAPIRRAKHEGHEGR